jgi:hypothetical protein
VKSFIFLIKFSVAEPEPQGAASFDQAKAATRCGSGSDGSGLTNGIKNGYELKNYTK